MGQSCHMATKRKAKKGRCHQKSFAENSYSYHMLLSPKRHIFLRVLLVPTYKGLKYHILLIKSANELAVSLLS